MNFYKNAAICCFFALAPLVACIGRTEKQDTSHHTKAVKTKRPIATEPTPLTTKTAVKRAVIKAKISKFAHAKKQIHNATLHAKASTPSIEQKGYYFRPGFNGGRHAHGGDAAKIFAASFTIFNPTTKPITFKAKKIYLLNAHCRNRKTWDSVTLLKTQSLANRYQKQKGKTNLAAITNKTTVTIAPKQAANLYWGHKTKSVYQACDRFGYRLVLGSAKGDVTIELPLDIIRFEPYRPRN